MSFNTVYTRKIFHFFAVLLLPVTIFLWLNHSGSLVFLLEKLQSLQNEPWISIPVFISSYVLFTILALPAAFLTLLAGGLFGAWLGTAIVSLASTLGAAAAFLIARYLGRDFIRHKLEHHERLQKIDSLITRQGILTVMLLRLVPLFPFNLLNYALGLSAIPFSTYLFWSWLGMLPGTFVYVAGGELAARGVSGAPIPTYLLYLVPIILLLLSLLSRHTRDHFSTLQVEPQEVE